MSLSVILWQGSQRNWKGPHSAEWGYDKQGYRDVYVLLDDSVEYTKSVCAGFDWLFRKRVRQDR